MKTYKDQFTPCKPKSFVIPIYSEWGEVETSLGKSIPIETVVSAKEVARGEVENIINKMKT